MESVINDKDNVAKNLELQKKKANIFKVPPKPKNPREEAFVIKSLESKDKKELGQKFYIIASSWWMKWENYTGYDMKYILDPTHPSEINNEGLLENIFSDSTHRRIKSTWMENRDVVIKSNAVWQTLHSW